MKLEDCPRCYGTRFFLQRVFERVRTFKYETVEIKPRGFEVTVCNFCWGRGKIPWLDAMLHKPAPKVNYKVIKHPTKSYQSNLHFLNHENKPTGEFLPIPSTSSLKRRYRKKGKKVTVYGGREYHVWYEEKENR